MEQSENKIIKHVTSSGLDELKNLSETPTKQCEQVSETINKINSLEVTFSVDD